MENKTKWKHPPIKEGLQTNRINHKLKKIKMKKDMNFSNVETFINILDDIDIHEDPNTKEGFVPTPIIPGVGLNNDNDYDGNDNIDNKDNKNRKKKNMHDYLRYISYIISYIYIFVRYLVYRLSESVYDTFSNGDMSENFDNVSKKQATDMTDNAVDMTDNAADMTDNAVDMADNAVDMVEDTGNTINDNIKDSGDSIEDNGNNVGQNIFSERYYIKAYNVLQKEFKGKTTNRAIDVELDESNKSDDMKVISDNILWIFSAMIGSTMSYSFYYYMFYTEKIVDNEAILDGGVNTIHNYKTEHHGNRVNFLPKGASVNMLAKDLLCELTSGNEEENMNMGNLTEIISSVSYKIMKPIVGLIEIFHKFIFVYIPNVVNGEHGFIGKDILPFFPNIGTLFKTLGLSSNGLKFVLITVMTTFFVYSSGSDFLKYLIDTISGTPKTNFFTLFIYLLISIVSFGLVYDSFKDFSKTTGLTGIKERVVGKNVTGAIANNVSNAANKTISSVNSAAKDNMSKVLQSFSGKPLTGGSNVLEEKCQDINENQSIFIKSLFGLESVPYISAFAYTVLLIINVIILFAILFILFGLGPIAIFVYVIGILGYSLVNGDVKMNDNIDIMTQLDPDDEIVSDVKIDSDWFNDQSKDEYKVNNAINYLNKINTVKYKWFNNIILRNSISIFMVLSLFYATDDIYKNIKNSNVRVILSILTGMTAFFYGSFKIMTSDTDVLIDYSDVLKMLNINKNDSRYIGLMDILTTSQGYGNNLNTTYTTDDISLLYNKFDSYLSNNQSIDNNTKNIQGGGILDDMVNNPIFKNITSAAKKGFEGIGNVFSGTNINEDKFILAVYYSIIKNKFGKYKPLSKLGNSFYDFKQNVHAKQTVYNTNM